MLTRILTAAVALAILIPVMVFGGVWGACALFTLICAFSTYEMLGCCGLKKHLAFSIPFIFFSAVIPVAQTLTRAFDASSIPAKIGGVALALSYTVSMLWVIFVAVIRYNKIESDRLFMFYGLFIYITFGFSAFLRLRFIENAAYAANLGLKIVSYVLIVSWATDAFAYFSGMAFGKRKLCPAISPKKTVAGAIGGTLLGAAAGAVFILIACGFSSVSVCLAAFAPLLSVVCQFGDLGASVIKRKFGVKDYGWIFPGHGGVLDRFDSVLPASLIVFAVMAVFFAL